METKIRIDQMKFRDLIAVYDLGNKLFTSDKWQNLYRCWDEYEILERFISDEKFCLVARADKKIIGFAIGTIIEKEKNPWAYGYLIWMGVHPKFIGQGVGKQLMRKATKLFLDAGAKIMMVDTSLANESALNFFKKNNFEEAEGHVFLAKNISEKVVKRKR